MSIAVSVVVKPSNLLLTLMTALCTGVLLVGLCILLGLVGELAIWLRLILALICATMAVAGYAHVLRNRKSYHLDISGAGQIRLTSMAHEEVGSTTSGMLVILLPDSTLWPWLLLLRLQDEGGDVHALPILRDSLSADSFRALAVACRWVAAHRNSELS
jgi:toxin CptA